MVAETQQREYQGTIHSQIRVPGASRSQAAQKMYDLQNYLTDNGIVVDQWSVPLIRDMEVEGDDVAKDRQTVLVAIEIESPSLGTAHCAAIELASRASEGSNDAKRRIVAAQQQADDYNERAANADAQADELSKAAERYREAAVVATERLGAIMTQYEGSMIQGTIVGYTVLDSQSGALGLYLDNPSAN